MLRPGLKKMTVFSIKKTSGGGTFWSRAGSAFVNRDGSLNVYLDVLPMHGTLHLREVADPKTATTDTEASLAVAGPADSRPTLNAIPAYCAFEEAPLPQASVARPAPAPVWSGEDDRTSLSSAAAYRPDRTAQEDRASLSMSPMTSEVHQ